MTDIHSLFNSDSLQVRCDMYSDLITDCSAQFGNCVHRVWFRWIVTDDGDRFANRRCRISRDIDRGDVHTDFADDGADNF